VAPERKRFLKNRQMRLFEDILNSSEKGDIFSLAITAFCLLFHELSAAELTDLD
jgi:hypothetical protein